jgi:hypothetical protein
MQILTHQGPALRAPRAARVAGTSPSIPCGDFALLPAGLSASLRAPLAFASPVRSCLRHRLHGLCCAPDGLAVCMSLPRLRRRSGRGPIFFCQRRGAGLKTFKSAPSQPVRPPQPTPSSVIPFSLIRDHSQVKSGAPAACKGALRRVLTRSVLAFGSAPHAASAPALASCLASAKPVARAKELTKDGSAGKQDTSQRRGRKPGLRNLRIRQF